MLKELRIKNLAIIGDLSVSFGEGLNVLTGETGAGKSIIVDALGLALGHRAQADMIRSGEEEASVQAYFEHDAVVSLPDIGIDISEDLVLRRTLSASGKSRAFVNDTLVTQQTLAEIGKSLVDIHSQHEHQSLLRTDKQRSMIDSFGKLQNELNAVASLYHEVQRLKHEGADLEVKVKERAYRVDLLRFQVNEIEAASLQAGEKELLDEERNILSNLSKLNELTETSYLLLYSSDNSCTEQLDSALSRLREMYLIDSSVEEVLRLLESAKPLVDDAVIALRGYREKYDIDPDRLEAVEERLDLIRNLEKKYGEGVTKILDYRDIAETELNTLESSDERLASIRVELLEKENALLQAARALSEKRSKTARTLETSTVKNLKELAMENPAFRIDVHQEKDTEGNYVVNAHGMDRIEFMFSANPGEPLKPLARIISGGELSRVMLALKSILAEVDSLPVLIFDEVDAGIGGRAAGSVGNKLHALARKHQLLCITHLPQIASLGDYHLKIEKKDKDKRATVDVRSIDGRERLDEISRMLSGTATETSLKHAEELLGRKK